ncbi:MAG: right-handed parallel beta-helix repeat-containing protein [Candidatus Micrarchaeota archaeon]
MHFYFTNSSNLTNSVIHTGARYGVDVGGSFNYLAHNQVSNQLQYGIHLTHPYNVLYNNTIFNSSECFLVSSGAEYSNLTNNTAYGCTSIGFYISGQYSNVTDGMAYDNGNGMYVTAGDITVTNGRYFENSYGIETVSDYSVIDNVTIHNNSQIGLQFREADDGRIYDTHLYNNTVDFWFGAFSSGNFTIHARNLTFDSDFGSMENYTSLDFFDDGIEPPDVFQIDWTRNSATLPPGRFSFAQKFVNISVVDGTVSIDAINWTWQDSEMGGFYNETKFELWKYNAGGWAMLNNTPNVIDNTLSLANMDPSSDYGILEKNVSECMIIDVPGTYSIDNNLTGAPISASPRTGTVCVKIAASNVDFSCNGYNITNNATGGGASPSRAIMVNGSYANVTIRDCPYLWNYSYDIELYQANMGRIINTSAVNGTYGFYLVSAIYTSIINSTVYDLGTHGIFVSAGSNYANLSNNTVYNIGSNGIYFGSSHNSTIANNTVYDASDCISTLSSRYLNITGNDASGCSDGIATWAGFFGASNYIRYEYNTVHDNGYGFNVWAHYNNFTNNTAYNNTYGLYAYGGFHRLDNNTAYNNTYGVYLSYTSDTSAAFTAAYNNSGDGLVVSGSSNFNASHTHLYSNGMDLRVLNTGGSDISMNFFNLTIDCPLGNHSNYTVLNITDIVEDGSGYTINWTINSSELPYRRLSFAQKFVNISYLDLGATFPGTIDSITWSWMDSELNKSGYPNDEAYFELWKYNESGWLVLNTTPDTVANLLSLTDMDPRSDYGILEWNATKCMLIDEAGFYQLENSLTGAPIDVSDIPSIVDWACIKIATSDVILNCNGFNITNDGTAWASAIVVNGSADLNHQNITIMNCSNLSAYLSGIEIFNSSYNVVQNMTISALGDPGSRGVYLYASDYTNITNVSAYNLQQEGLTLAMGSGNNLIRGCLVDTAWRGFHTVHVDLGTTYNVFDNNTAINCAQEGFWMACGYNASWTNFTNNIAYDNVMGFSLQGKNDHIENNTAYHNTWYDISPNNEECEPGKGGANFTLVNNTAYGMLSSDYCFFNAGATNITYINSTAYNCTYGFGVAGGSYAYVQNLTSYGNGYGLYFTPLGFSPTYGFHTFSNVSVYDNGYGMYLRSNNLTLNDVHVHNSSVLDMNVSTGTTPINISFANITFDSPPGQFENYTRLYLNDSLEANSWFSVNWTVNSSALPSQRFSFEQKFVNISDSGIISIDAIQWVWSESEVVGIYNESRFELWKFNATDGWTMLNNTPDLTANRLALFDFDPSSDYGILEKQVSSCMVIGTPGEYELDNNITGATIGASEVSGIAWACIKIASDDVVFDCNGYNITNDGTSDAAGIAINGSIAVDYTNITVTGCKSVYDYEKGIVVHRTQDVQVVNNTFINATEYGIHLYYSNYVNVSGNEVEHLYGGGIRSGIVLQAADYNQIVNNTPHGYYNTNQRCIFDDTDSQYNNYSRNIAYTCEACIYLRGDYANATNNTANNCSSYGIIATGNYGNYTDNIMYESAMGIYGTSDYSNFSNNLLYENTQGLYLTNAVANNVTNNTAHSNAQNGIVVYSGANYNNLSGNVAYNNSYGFLFRGDYNTIANSTAHDNSASGFWLDLGAENNNFSLCSASSNRGIAPTHAGFTVGQNYNNVSGSTAFNNSNNGFYFGGTGHYADSDLSYNNTIGFNFNAVDYFNITNSTAYYNRNYGMYATSSTYGNFSNNTAHGNSFGLYISNSGTNNTNASYIHLYNNSDAELIVDEGAATGSYILLEEIYIDCPLGNFTNYTNLTIYDIFYTGEGYGINWTMNESALPAYRTSFREKYINITSIGSAPTINYIIWNWDDSEAGAPYDEDYFELWKFNATDGWTMLNDTPDTTANELRIDNLVPSSDYGILQKNLTGCIVIDSAGGYQLDNNVEGAPNDASEVTNIEWACIKIASDNVIFDCNGYNITNDGTAEAAAIVVNGSVGTDYSNVTIANCPLISGYEDGVTIFRTVNVYVDNVTVYNATNISVRFDGTGDSILNDSTLYNTTAGFGAVVYDGENITLLGNYAFNNTYGYYLESSTNSLVDSSNASLNSGYGLWLQGSSSNTIDPSWFCNNSGSGIFIDNSDDNIIDDSVACNNTEDGIRIEGSNNTLINRSSVYLNGMYGVNMSNGDYTNMSLNNVTNNTVGGLLFDSASTSGNLTSDVICWNGFDLNNTGGSTNTGDNDSCDSFSLWTENSHMGCEYTCSEMWHRFFGNASGNINLTDASATSNVFSWPGSAYNVYFADYDSTINWSGLQAIGRTTTDTNSTNDFGELDIAFETQSFADNIEDTYSVDGSAPKNSSTFIVYSDTIGLVPVAASAWNSTFYTGILWDTSDGGTEFTHTINQSTVWVVNVSSAAMDTFGTYDYLQSIPESLATYEGATDMVTIYVELT